MSKERLEAEWIDMPEFVQEKKKAYAEIIFRFDNEDELSYFSELIGQKLHNKMKSAWFQQLVRGIHSKKRYIDES